MNIKQFPAALVTIAIANPMLSVAVLTTTIAIVPSIIAPQPATAAWYDQFTGVYMNIAGSQYYFGDYVQDPNPKFNGSTWEVTCGSSSNVCAHGYNRSIPRVVQWLAQRMGR